MSTKSQSGGLSQSQHFCFECQTHRFSLNGKCCQCKEIIEISDNPEEGVQNIKYNNTNNTNGSEGQSPFPYTFSDTSSNISPISSNKNRNHNRNRNRNRKRKPNFNTSHYPNNKKLKTEPLSDDDIVINNIRNKSNPIIIDDNHNSNFNKIHPDFSNSDSDSDSSVSSHSSIGMTTKGIRISPPSSPPTSPSMNNANNINNRIVRLNLDNDINGYISESPSLSVIKDMNRLTFRHRHQGSNIDKWKALGIKNKTLKGLETLDTLNIPSKEGIALMGHVRKHMGHVIASILQHEDRLLYLIVGLLEIMKFNHDNGYTNRKVQVMVVSSRRHAAIKCGQLIKEIGKFYGVLAETIIGGMQKYQCIQKLKGDLDVLAVTPGQCCSMIRHGHLNKKKMSNLLAFVMDDADELVSGKSICDQMKLITSILPDRKIKVLWLESVIHGNDAQTAIRYIRHDLDKSIVTMAQEKKMIKVVTENAMDTFANRNDLHIMAQIDHEDERKKALYQILDFYNGEKFTIVYFNRKTDLFNIYDEFCSQDDEALPKRKRFLFCLSGAERRNIERQHTIDNFSEDGGILFCSDLLSKGISLPKNIVINYNMPMNTKGYISRCSGKDKNQRVAVFNLVGMEKGNRYLKSRDEMRMDDIRNIVKNPVKNYMQYSKNRKENGHMRKNKIFDDV